MDERVRPVPAILGRIYYYPVHLPASDSSSALFLSVLQPAIPSVPPRFLTSGSWDVSSLCALDEEAGKMYVRGTLRGAGRSRCNSTRLKLQMTGGGGLGRYGGHLSLWAGAEFSNLSHQTVAELTRTADSCLNMTSLYAVL